MNIPQGIIPPRRLNHQVPSFFTNFHKIQSPKSLKKFIA